MPKIHRKHINILVGGVLLTAVAVGGWRLASSRLGALNQVDAIHIDMAKPDVVIQSNQFNQLPQQLLSIPVLKDILTQDVVFYYQQAPSKLSLQGSLQRLAFEHNVQWEDRLINQMLAREGEMYVWQGHTNKPEHWLFVGNSNAFSKTSEWLAKIALDDSQLVQVDTIKVDGDSIPLYAVRYQGKTGLFAATANRVAFLSDAGMLVQLKPTPKQELQLEAKVEYDQDGKEKITPLTMPKAEPLKGSLISDRVDIVEQLLSQRPEKQHTITDGLNLTKDKQQPHSLYVSAAMMTLSYQDLMDGLVGSRFVYNGSNWQQAVAVKTNFLPSQQWDGSKLYQQMPHNAAFCSAAPINWQALAKQADKLPSKTDALALPSFNQPIVACWYSNSPAAAPLFVTQLPASEHKDAQLAALQQVFNDVIGAKEYTHKKRFDVSSVAIAGAHMQERIVSARYGSHAMKQLQDAQAKELSALRYFPVAYAVSGDYVWFSPNGDLVKQAVAVNKKQAPAVSEAMNNHAKPLLWINGPELAKWLQKQTNDVIADDSDMRTVLSQRFTPKLRLIANSGVWQVAGNQSVLKANQETLQWMDVTWQHPR